jgi:hypothetical protein
MYHRVCEQTKGLGVIIFYGIKLKIASTQTHKRTTHLHIQTHKQTHEHIQTRTKYIPEQPPHTHIIHVCEFICMLMCTDIVINIHECT